MELEIYMKSGNCIHVDGIESWRIKNQGDLVTEIELVNKDPNRKLILGALSLNQIEGIVEVKQPPAL